MQFEKTSQELSAARDSFLRAKKAHAGANLGQAQVALVEAIAQLTRDFGESDPQLAECYEMLGDNAFAQDNFDDALFAYQACLDARIMMRVNPADNLELKLTIALTKMKLKRLEEAEADLVVLLKEALALLPENHPFLAVTVEAHKSVQKQLPARRRALLEAEEKAYAARQNEKRDGRIRPTESLRTYDDFHQPISESASSFLKTFSGGTHMLGSLACAVAGLALVATIGLNFDKLKRNPFLDKAEGSCYQGVSLVCLDHGQWKLEGINNEKQLDPVPYVAVKDPQSLAKALLTKSTYWNILDEKGLIDEDGNRYFSDTKDSSLMSEARSQAFFINAKYKEALKYPTLFVESLMSVPTSQWNQAYDSTYFNPYKQERGFPHSEHIVAQVRQDIAVPGVPLDQQMDALLKGQSWDGDIHQPGTIGLLNYCPPGQPGVFLIHLTGSDGRLLRDNNGPVIFVLRDGKVDLPKMSNKDKIKLIVIAPLSRPETVATLQLFFALFVTIATAIILVLQLRFQVSIFELAMDSPQWLKMAGLVIVAESVLGLCSINVSGQTAVILAIIQTLLLLGALIGCLLWFDHRSD